MSVLLLTFIYFAGQGLYFVALSPYVVGQFKEDSPLIFLSGQLAMPLGFFISGYLSDRTRKLRAPFQIGQLVQIPIQYGFFSIRELSWLPFDTLTLGLVFSGLLRFIFAFNLQLLTLIILEKKGHGNFGNIRVWGTLAFLAINLLFFWQAENRLSAAETGKGGLFFLAAGFLLATFAPATRTSRQEYFFLEALRLLKKSRIIFFFILSFLFYFQYQMEDLYLGQFIYNLQGMRGVFLTWSLAVVFEIPAMLLAFPLSKRSGLRPLFLIATLAAAIRFGMLSLVAAGLAGSGVLALSHTLHGIMFTFFYLGYIFYLRGVFPEHLFGTGSGLFTILAIAGGSIAGNQIYGRLIVGTSPSWPTVSVYLLAFGPATIAMLLLFFAFLLLPFPAHAEKKTEIAQ
ncbi:MAG: MFS transporter [Spirochaetales bacterium]|nr:MFS transporter [Spirochaetales bacterium]